MLSQGIAKITGAKVLAVLISPITAVLVVGGVILWRQNKQHAKLLQKIEQQKKTPQGANVDNTTLLPPPKNNPRAAMFKQIVDDNIALRTA